VKPFYIIQIGESSLQLKRMLDAAWTHHPDGVFQAGKPLPDLQNARILFAIQINAWNLCPELSTFFMQLDPTARSLAQSEAAILIHSDSERYSRDFAVDLILRANELGCRFMGRPVVEAAKDLVNWKLMETVKHKTRQEICVTECEHLVARLVADNPVKKSHPSLLVLHASNAHTSSTLQLWALVKKNLPQAVRVQEIHIENGTVRDCIGCPYTTCKHFGEQMRCFYGGVMVEEIYPAILKADAILWICPNYNDALSANLTATVNRMTALFRTHNFYNKSLFGIVVSGNSGSECLQHQLISALNINKTFRLPPQFSLTATANDKNAILERSNIEFQAAEYARNLANEIKTSWVD
jgi:multimeric flavodoxin WrbA